MNNTKTKRVLFYVHFNKYDQLSEHVLYQLKKINPLYDEVVLISNSEVSDIDKKKLNGLYSKFIQRENKGFDFAAWRDGIKCIGWGELEKYNSVTLMNDTCFGPIYPMEPIYESIENSAADFWGMTNHRASKHGMPGTNGSVPESLQSYFLVFKHNVVASTVFKDFWNNVNDYDNVNDVIRKYETQLTNILTNSGYKYEAFFNTTDIKLPKKMPVDFSLYNPSQILSKRVPFIKIKMFHHNETLGNFIINYIRSNTKYPTDLILEHMSNMDLPDREYLVSNKILDVTSVKKQKNTQKIAVHVHVFYVDILDQYLDEFSKWSFEFDLFLTTDTPEKEQVITKKINSRKNLNCKKIIVTGNKGRDVIPWFEISKYIDNYDIAGHFHTKKSLEADMFAGDSWRNDLIDMLIKPADRIMTEFQNNSKLGLVIADIPGYFRYSAATTFFNEAKLKDYLRELWDRMDNDKDVDFNAQTIYVMSYGTMQWYRPEVLKKLTSLQLIDEEVPSEPLGQFTILHAIERLPVYVAWAAGYDYRISPYKKYVSGFIDNKAYNVVASNHLYNSKYFKLGHKLAWPAVRTFKKIKKLAKDK